MGPRVRVFVKVGAFSFALFFIMYFVVYGVRYTDGVGFVTKNAFYEASFWSDGQKVSFDNIEYRATDKKVQLFNIDAGCYDVAYQGLKNKECVYKNSVTLNAFVTYKETVPYEPTPMQASSCVKVDRQPHGEYSVKGMLFAKPIQSVFVARTMNFIQQDNTLFVCNATFQNCHEVGPMDGEILCSVKDGLVFHKDNALYLMELD